MAKHKKRVNMKPILDYREYLRVGDAAKLLGVCVQTLRNWDKNGKLKPYRHTMSSYRLYKKEDLIKLLEEAMSDKA